VKKGISQESFPQFQNRVLGTLHAVGSDLVDKVILSMEKRMQLIVKGDGERLFY